MMPATPDLPTAVQRCGGADVTATPSRAVLAPNRAEPADRTTAAGAPAFRGLLDGVLCLDKPAGMTSFAAVAAVRRTLGVEKAGHAGTLDPLATGVLPVCLGEGTKLVQFLIEHNKVYLATVVLGASTDTQDAAGRVVAQAPYDHVTAEAVLAAAQEFVGRVAQKVPAYSAVRVGGQRLYERARRGEEVDAPVREVQIDAVRVLSCDFPRIDLEVSCGRGTYIRALASDLGEKLGTLAHLGALRRTRVGRFSLERAVTLETLREQAALLRAPAAEPRPHAEDGATSNPIAEALQSLREALGTEIAELRLCAEDTARLMRSGSVPAQAWAGRTPVDQCAVTTPMGELCAVVRITENSCKTLRVFHTPSCIPSRADVVQSAGTFDPGVEIT